MLIQFCFENYKSFRDETILDLSATGISEQAQQVVRLGTEKRPAIEKILPVAAIYGANASGKSNVLEAFRFMVEYVRHSFAYGGSLDDKTSKRSKPVRKPFLFDAAYAKAGSTFEVYFIDTMSSAHRCYNYGFVLSEDGVAEEWLNSKGITVRNFTPVFYREGDEISYTGLDRKSQSLINAALNKETLIVSLGGMLKIQKLKIVQDWFFNAAVVDFGEPMENAFRARMIPNGFDQPEVQAQVVDYLSKFDDSIIGFRVEKVAERDTYNIWTVHRQHDGTVELPLEEESAGTLKMFALYPEMVEALSHGGVLMVDELNARLHPLLVRNIVQTFLDPVRNPAHAQLIFTTHDAWQLADHLLRRDEIWFTEKDSDGASSLYSLAEFVDADGDKIRKDESYVKNYLLGKYGAVPRLRAFNAPKEG